MNYYAWANRYRGSKSKLGGCALLAVPSCAVYALAWGLGYAATGYACWWAVLGFSVLTMLKVILMFTWWHDSDAWRFPEKMAKQWKRKGMVGFGLLGMPFLGSKMEKVGQSYADNFTDEVENKQAVEWAEGETFCPLEIESTGIHIAIVALFYVARAIV